MAGLRADLDAKFEAILGSENVYFSPTNNLDTNYPCIIYQLIGQNTIFADDKKYRKLNQYSVTIVDEDPDSEIIEKIEELQYCYFSRAYEADYLNHWVYNLYY